MALYIDGEAVLVDTTLMGTTVIGTATSQKVGFYNVTPVTQQTGVATQKTNYTTGELDVESEIITAFNTTNGAINTIRTAVNALGLTSTV